MTETPTQDANLDIQTKTKQPSQNLFFWIAYGVFGIFIALGTLDGNPYVLVVFMLWFLPVFLMMLYRRIATALALIGVVLMWSLLLKIMIQQYYFWNDDDWKHGEGSEGAFLIDWFFCMFLFIPLSILLISGIRSLIRCFKDAKAAAALADCEESS